MNDIAPILSVANLSMAFSKGGEDVTNVVNGVGFDLYKGKTLALVGESGSGKSITALSVLRLLDDVCRYGEGSAITYHGDGNILAMNDRDVRAIRGKKIAMIFQEPMTSLNPLHTIGRQIEESLKIHTPLNSDAREDRIVELLKLVGLDRLIDRLNAYPHELSGGQRQRVMIAMALACEPDILIADEPTTALDVTVQAQILELLADLQSKMGMAVLLITHDLSIVRHYSHDIAVMRHGEIVERGPTADVFEKPKHDYTKMLMAAQPKGNAKPIAKTAPVILVGDNVSLSYPKKKNFFGRVIETVDAVKNVSFDLRQGETLGIVGESGSGKSTLGFSILRLLKPSGRIVLMGQDIASLSEGQVKPLRADMQIVFQDPFGSLSPRMTVGDIIAEGLHIHQPHMSKVDKDQAVIDVLERVRLSPDNRHRFPHEFSGGQRQRISIARALILKPKMIVMDEPTSALDMSVQEDIVNLLRDLQQSDGLSYIFISHDLRVVKALSHRVLVMKDGEVIEQGPANDIFEKPANVYTKTLIDAAFNIKVS